MKEISQYINASTELQQEIADKFKVTTRTVRSALNYETNSPSARLLRSYALNHGGKLYEVRLVENPCKEVITL